MVTEHDKLKIKPYLGRKQVKVTVFEELIIYCTIVIHFQLQATFQNSFKLKLSKKLVFD